MAHVISYASKNDHIGRCQHKGEQCVYVAGEWGIEGGLRKCGKGEKTVIPDIRETWV